jgi:hypothetical protein
MISKALPKDSTKESAPVVNKCDSTETYQPKNMTGKTKASTNDGDQCCGSNKKHLKGIL